MQYCVGTDDRLHSFVPIAFIYFTILVGICCLLNACSSSHHTLEPQRVYEGIVTLGFEDHSFLPCGVQERWLIGGDTGAIRQLNEEYARITQREHEPIYARLRGAVVQTPIVVVPFNYQRQFTLTEILFVREKRPRDCEK